VSWQLAIICLLVAMLLAGIAWYERSRPPAQVVALVAVLAALAVAGRIALSPVPNVLPSTDIVLIAGYTLGGAPGFAAGALTALVSNFWLGQGPWTPWQMAGWGMCGIAGALLASATGRSLGRIGLAVACGVAGFAYGALLDLSLMVTYGGEQSLDRFLALSARGLPFNAAHAAGNVAFALVAGPALTRMLTRYRERFEFAWGGRPRTAAATTGAAAILAAVALVAPVTGGEPARGAEGSGSAVGWLKQAKEGSGGFAATPGDEPNPAMTGWAILGLEAAGRNPLDLGEAGSTPIAYLRETADEVRTTGDMERTILALTGAGIDLNRFGGRLVERLRARRSPDGSWSGQVNPTAFGLMALEAAGSARASGASAGWLLKAQNDDGGWGFAPGAMSDADSTGAALQGLAAAGRRGGGMRRGVGWLRRAQRPGGGFNLLGGPVNTQSTAWAVQGLVAAGVSPSSVRSGGRSPLDYLASVQAEDGHYRYSASTDQTPVWVTAQALLAVNQRSLPLAPVPRQARRGGGGGAAGPGAAAPPRPGKRGKATPEAQARGAAAGATAASPPPPAAVDNASASGADDDGGGSLPWIAAGVVIALAAAIWAGWIAYRRRLPAR
jgi:energy-coupling factor transport system substrate-specific component